jgi:hypothetical protein
MQHLAMLRIHLESRQNKTKDIQEAVMSLASVYAKWEQENLIQVRQSREEGRQEIVMQMLGNPKYALGDISQLTGLPIAQLKRLQKSAVAASVADT